MTTVPAGRDHLVTIAATAATAVTAATVATAETTTATATVTVTADNTTAAAASASRSLRRQAGVTVVESLISVAVAAVMLGASLPGYEQARERRHLHGAAAQIETDIHFARSLAVAHDRALRMSVVADGATSCYVVHGGPAISDCRCADIGPAACSARPQTWRVVRFGTDTPVQLRANVGSIVFDPHQGTSTPTATMRFVGRSGAEVRAVVSLMGRVRQCAPAPGMPGLPTC